MTPIPEPESASEAGHREGEEEYPEKIFTVNSPLLYLNLSDSRMSFHSSRDGESQDDEQGNAEAGDDAKEDDYKLM